ncbi:MAG: AAA-like domain-containing protein [Caldilineaceae bacterium]|nr:AAA-like domain-containing protein [Caldilineaceae bacterium]
MSETNFFKAGGTLSPESPSYVKRDADSILLNLVRRGELCYVLNTRQMGKSSLMVQTMYQLGRQDEIIHPVKLDLSQLSRSPIEQWYYSLAALVVVGLKLPFGLLEWWNQHEKLDPAVRFVQFLRNAVLTAIDGQVAIFIDEIDSLINHEFADDFLAAIRSMYNERATDKEFSRITFVLLGTAAPHDLIRDHTRTPFNVGRRINLNDLRIEDAEKLVSGLPGHDRTILERIFYWTNGHPYLTQKLGEVISESSIGALTNDQIDEQVQKLFLTESALVEEVNFDFIQNRILQNIQKNQLLTLYRKIYRNRQKIQNDEQSLLHSELKIVGLVRADEDGNLTIRNRIYEQVFDLAWVNEHLPTNWWRVTTYITLVSSFILLTLFIMYSQRSIPQPDINLPSAVRTNYPPDIDGRLDDLTWKNIQPLIFAQHPANNDSSTASVRLVWDDNYLYAAFDVNDTQVEQSSETPWDGDSVSIVIDYGDHVQEYRHSLKGIDLADRRGQPPGYSVHKLKGSSSFDDPSDIDLGYTVEFRIPWELSPVIGTPINIDLVSVDHDRNPGGKFNDAATFFSKLSWDADQNVDTAQRQIVLSNECESAYFVSPQGTEHRHLASNFRVPDTIPISWEPADCPMIVQLYQDNKLTHQYSSVMSGTDVYIAEAGSGETEIKIWKSGSYLQADTMWLWVE